nr:VTT domain-containing protein [Enterovirga sp. DB1703]
MVAVPRPLLSVVCGFAFGWWGLPLAFVSAALGASLVFVVGRHLLRPRISERVARSRVADAAFRAVELEGFRAVLLLRMSPVVPSSIQSYLFSITSLDFRAYIAGTVLGTLPAMVLQVWTGTLGRTMIEAGLPAGTTALWAMGLVALVLATALIGRRLRGLLLAEG